MNEKEITKDLLKYYKFVSQCKKCNNLFGHDTKSEKLCVKCDPNTIKRIKERLNE